MSSYKATILAWCIPLLLLLRSPQSVLVHAALQLTPYVSSTACNMTNTTLPAISLPTWQSNVSAPCVAYTTGNELIPGSPSWLAISCSRLSATVSLYYYSVNGGCPSLSTGYTPANFTYYGVPTNSAM